MHLSLPLLQLESELKKRWKIPYVWGKKQNNCDDIKTNIIYQTPFFEEITQQISHFPEDLQMYALNRWYNFWSAKAVETIFSQSPEVHPVFESKDSQKDFFWKTIPFDHKTTVFPKAFAHSVEYAQHHPEELISWLYKNQSSEKRQHFENRIFVVVNHWKDKAELLRLHSTIHTFLQTFSLSDFITFRHTGKDVSSAIIWALF